jgi:uncharacterized protein (DUF2141 family)
MALGVKVAKLKAELSSIFNNILFFIIGMDMAKCFSVLVGLFFVNLAVAQQSDLSVTVTSIADDTGSIVIAVFDNADNWLSTKVGTPAFLDVSREVVGETEMTFLIEDIPAGSYALSIFHDVNANGELDTSFIGYPKEPFGFSAPMGAFGPPSFFQASIKINEGLNEIIIAID